MILGSFHITWPRHGLERAVRCSQGSVMIRLLNNKLEYAPERVNCHRRVVHTIVHALFEPEYHDTRCLLLFTSKSQPPVLFCIAYWRSLLDWSLCIYCTRKEKQDTYQYVHSVTSRIKDIKSTSSTKLVEHAYIPCKTNSSQIYCGLFPCRKMNEEKHFPNTKEQTGKLMCLKTLEDAECIFVYW